MSIFLWIAVVAIIVVAIAGGGLVLGCRIRNRTLSMIGLSIMLLATLVGGVSCMTQIVINMSDGYRASTAVPAAVTVYNTDSSVLKRYTGNMTIKESGSGVTIEVDGETYTYYNNPVEITYEKED